MPRPVVPILATEFEASRARSSSPWMGRIRAVFSAIISVSGLISTPWARDFLDLAQKVPGVQHHAVADNAQLFRTHHARRQGVQFENLAIDHQRMTGVVAALKPGDHIGALGKPVDDFSLALVAPLGTDHNDVGHQTSPMKTRADIAGGRAGRNRKIVAELPQVRRTASVAQPGPSA